MNRSLTTLALATSLLVASSYSLRAEVRADEKGRVEFGGMLGHVVNIFGGRAAREGVTSMIAVKGDRKARITDVSGQIIDLAEEKIYDLDMRRKTYKVTTFDELRRQMQEAREKAEAEASKDDSRAQSQTSPEDPNQKQIEIDFSVKNTGETKIINGFDTHEAVMTIAVREKGKTLEQGGGLVLTSDMWIAPKIAAMKEIAEFDVRYARKLQGPMMSGASPEQMAAALAMYPHLKEAIARMHVEGAKLEGTPIQTMTKIEAVKSPEQIQQEQESEQASQASGGIGGRLMGGLAKKIAKKKAGGDSESSPRTTVMVLDSEVLNVSTSVAAGDVAIPAEFRQK